MPTSFCGTWDMISNVNFEGYMVALGEYFKNDLLKKTGIKNC